ncbi:MAG: proton-conducting transporter membrane subunit [Bacteroidales bacterium]|jgi:hydrogenase-4 component F|nr:proton-conducting transporter membrane subunit [Bacteroidales bacterium]
MILLFFYIISVLMSILIVLLGNRTFTRITAIGYALLHILFTIYCWASLGKTELIYFTYTPEGVLLLSALSFLAVPVIYHGFIYASGDEVKRFNIYHSALIALMMFMSGAYLANGMTVLWIFVEATTLAVAALIYYDRTEIALEAAWKYVFICSTGIALAYLGILFLGFIYGREDASTLSFASLSGILNQANPMYLKIAFVFVLIGFSTKMGLFPMHTVTIDAHSVAPPPVSALISTTLMNVGFLAIFRVYKLFSSSPILPFMNNVLILSGLLSLLIAAGYMLKAKHLKRMLAYSSLENMGLVAIAIGAGGIGYYAALLLLILHTLTKSGLFFQMGQLSRILHTFRLDECGNYMKLYPAGALVLLAGMICILAIPPSGLFISEFMIFKELVSNDQWLILSLVIILLCFVIYAMSTRIMHIVFSSPRGNYSPLPPGKVNSVETVSQFVFLGLVIAMCFYQPQFLVDLINQSIAVLPK